METQLSGRKNREITGTAPNTFKKCQKICPETIVLGHYIEHSPGAELPNWAIKAGLRIRIKDGRVRFKAKRKDQESHDQTFVPVTMRVSLTQRMYVGTQTGDVGYKSMLPRLPQKYIWGNMASDTQKVIKTCIHCRRHNKNYNRSVPMRWLPRGQPGEVVAMDLFRPLSKTKAGNLFIPALINHFSRWPELIALKKAEVFDAVSALRDAWMSKHGVPSSLLNSGPRFAASVVRCFSWEHWSLERWSLWEHWSLEIA